MNEGTEGFLEWLIANVPVLLGAIVIGIAALGMSKKIIAGNVLISSAPSMLVNAGRTLTKKIPLFGQLL